MSGYWSHLECCWVSAAHIASTAEEAAPEDTATTLPAELPAQRAVPGSQEMAAPASR